MSYNQEVLVNNIEEDDIFLHPTYSPCGPFSDLYYIPGTWTSDNFGKKLEGHEQDDQSNDVQEEESR